MHVASASGRLLAATGHAVGITVLQAGTPTGSDPLGDPRIVIGTLTSALGGLTLLIVGGYVLSRRDNDRRSQLLLIALGGGFTSVFTGVVIAARSYLEASAFVLAMALLYGALVNFYVRL